MGIKDLIKGIRNQKVSTISIWRPEKEHIYALRRAILKAEKGSDTERWLRDLYEQLKPFQQ